MSEAAGGAGAHTLGPEDRARAVAAIRAQLRSGDGGEDGLIGMLADSAIGIAELFLGTLVLRRAVVEPMTASAGWTALAARPVRAITAVATIGAEGGAEPLPVERYGVDIDAGGTGWVRVTGAGAMRVVVTLEAGLAEDWDALPAAVRQGIVMLAAHLFDARVADGPPPAAVAALWRPYRRMALNGARR